ncbi:carboxylesterase family protein [Pseudomonas synxantha]|uniref:Uncharacterized protein n=1 Tax=Pseudomonas synxantha TaxID=47883 RepID=A0ACC6JQM9_9PSED|nr:carboxylesterase family protein [Pseudomonas synxantha]MDR6608683.1 hypothetical protein [Pseudomonas synxantha]
MSDSTTKTEERFYNIKNGIHTFKGIPYAAPLTAQNRFVDAREPDNFAETRPAIAYGPNCPQAEREDWNYKRIHGTVLGTLQVVLGGRFDKNDFVLLQMLKPQTWSIIPIDRQCSLVSVQRVEQSNRGF